MQISMEFFPARADRLQGRVLTEDGRAPLAFSGTLDLLRVIEEVRQAHPDADQLIAMPAEAAEPPSRRP